MPAPLSIIVPTLNAADGLPAMADALLEGVTSGLVSELVLSDGGSTDAIAEVAEALGARLVTGAPGRGGQIARGVAASQGPWLLILHADTRLGAGWAEAAHAHMDRAPEHAGYFRLAFDATGIAPRVVAGWANLRSRLFGLPYGDQGLLLSRDLFRAVGGMPDIPLMEDVALSRALRGRLREVPVRAVTSAARYEAEGWLRRGGRNLAILARYRMGADPARLVGDYARRR